ncbi:desert hedgehog protein B-like [Parasteatoda tepidariorum]|uniref:desert hedgehog protein B-like n=1 Tax=Parasteatoda tepidariorum TaxID=114398 RepID=UPI001C71CC9A|nr:desert hedgehog protein B-like [Parasteatoda tepidariorum]
MLTQGFRKLLTNFRTKQLWIYVYLIICTGIVEGCLPGRGGGRRRSPRKLTPLVYKQHVPNVSEYSLAASGPSSERIVRNSTGFKLLVPNYNADVIFKDEEGTGADRLMTQRCKEILDTLAISVMNQWPGVRLRVTEGFDEEGHHSPNSLHYSGRAVDITTSDRDRSKYGMLARLAVEAGFNWVYYESRGHIHCSVRSDSDGASRGNGCFHSSSTVTTRNGIKLLKDVEIGDEVASRFSPEGSLIYSTVINFLHRDYELKTDFIRVRTNSNNTLLLTPNHLIFRYSKQLVEAVLASDINPGDLLLIKLDNNLTALSAVLDLTIFSLTGVHAPVTEDGTIIVNDIYVSCYATVRSHTVAHLTMLPLRINFLLKRKGLELGRILKIPKSLLKYLYCQCIKCEDTSSVNRVLNSTKSFKTSFKGVHWYAKLLYFITLSFLPKLK